jgi:hypothetical protein
LGNGRPESRSAICCRFRSPGHAVTRTTYFNSDEIHFFKKDLNIFDRIQVSHMAQFKMHWISLTAPKLEAIAGHLI